jgi:predicted XRE-type DNA-binding protein
MSKAITRGTTNLFADLGYADADVRQTKTRLALEINGIIKSRKLKQVEAGELLGVHQPKVSTLANYRLDGFFSRAADGLFDRVEPGRALDQYSNSVNLAARPS